MGVPMAMCNYHVFLSFRGPDVRDNFLECFSDLLRGAGFVVFEDRREILYGERIDDKILEAIKRSYVCVPVFSEDFASSPACLMEVAQMVESKKTILPIFYGVEPCDVRYQRKTYGESFAEHERKNRYPDHIGKWKAALREITGEMSPIFKNVNGGYLERLKDFIFRLRKLLRMDEQDVTENLVGIDRDVPEMMRKLGFYEDGQVVKEWEMTGRCVLAVWGLPGVGKTTLTKVLFNKISKFFEGCSFLENVWDEIGRDEIKQKGVVSLQNRLIRDLKGGGDSSIVESSNQGTKMIRWLFKESRVLIVLDDVDDFEQIRSLAEPTWFGPRSRIILTTRRKDISRVQISRDQVISYEHDHEILPMNESHALELFRKCAPLDHHLKNGDKMSREIISAVEYLPLAIDIVGRYLNGKKEYIWKQTLDDLKGSLQEKVERRLKANYEILGKKTREIFLDIACFFTGVEKTIPFYMWAARELRPDVRVDELQNTSFLKIGGKNEFLMHGQLKFLGREIVKSEYEDPRQRSRLWDNKDVKTILCANLNWQGTSRVEALSVPSDFSQVNGEVFHYLSNLRFLELDNVDIEGNYENLLPNLLWLDWRGCHEKPKLFAFKMENLVILNLCSSSIKLNLEDWKKLMQKAGRLKVLNLKGCTWINGSLEFPASRHLECLILEDCLLFSPTTIQNSISKFENLVSLNMKRCKLFKHLPQALGSMKALKELLIDGTKIQILHFEEGSLPALEILSACECEALGKVTDSIVLLKKLQKLNLRSCKTLEKLPAVIGELVLLQEMDLSDTLIKELPPSVKNMENLEVLKMVGTYLKGFPEAIKDLQKLEELDFTHCRSLRGHCNIRGLFSLRILRLKCTGISHVLARDNGQACLPILELDDHIVWQTVP